MVERDNRILLEKMSKIMRTHGSVDHRNDYEYKRQVYKSLLMCTQPLQISVQV